MRSSLFALAIISAFGFGPAHAGDPILQQLQVLTARIGRLEADQAALHQQVTIATATS